MPHEIETSHARCVFGEDGTAVALEDKRTGENYLRTDGGATPLARLKQAGQEHVSTSVSSDAAGGWRLRFGDSGIEVRLGVQAREQYWVIEVLEVIGDGVEELTFLDMPLSLVGCLDEPFAACVMALNLQTNVPSQVPMPMKRLRACCVSRVGLQGAKAAVVACPPDVMRSIMQEVVGAAEDLPTSDIGGPWALDAAINRGSYLFNFGGLTEDTVDDWIALAKSIGFTQIDFHGGRSFRFGDFRPDPEMYPRGVASLKAVIDRLHAAGIAAGLHTYAFFIDKRCPWVTPVPDPRLGALKVFTLAEALDADADTVTVAESTADRSTDVGFFARNSVTLRIDEELIRFGDFRREPPYGFTSCERGAQSTRPTSHAKGAAVHHLKECFGLFSPDGDSSLLVDVAAKTAEAFNACGFDMIYLDALDGGDILEGREYEWHYGAKFVFEICKRLNKPALMEMSTFYHHLWYVRSRIGAWDHPIRSHKRFIDMHVASNESGRRMFLPAHLGWWAAKTWFGAQGERTFSDDFEYLCGKCIGHDCGFSIMGIDPDNIKSTPALQRLTGMIKEYEDLRHAGHFSETMKAKLRVPGDEYTLTHDASGTPVLEPVQYARHKVEGVDERTLAWTVKNRFGPQSAGLRIEALTGTVPYDSPDAVALVEFENDAELAEREIAEDVTLDLAAATEQSPDGNRCVRLSALNKRAERRGAWGMWRKTFTPPLDLTVQASDEERERSQGEAATHIETSEACQRQAIAFWVKGDGKGAVLNLQVRSPEYVTPAIGDHYVILDFEGWRYVELIEPEGERYADYAWPYAGMYHIYRECVNYERVGTLGLWLNNLPPGEEVACLVSPVRALPVVDTVLRRPAVTIGGRTIVFPVDISTGCYLECRSSAECVLYGREGEVVGEVTPEGNLPEVTAGDNDVRFDCEDAAARPRAAVTVIARGEADGV